MRTRVFALLVAAACGKNANKVYEDAPAGGGEPMPTIDAPAMATCTPTSGTKVTMRKIAQVSGSAILATSPPNDGRLFVIEQAGRIRIIDNAGNLLPTPFLDVRQLPDFAAGGEQGLLGLAFHPQYFQNNYFYVWYTTGPCGGSPPAALPCGNVLERFTASSTDLNKADPNSGVVLLQIPDFASNHNGGMLEFGSDGYLYVGTGDGGAGGDPAGNGQNTNALLAKMLRIDVDHPAGGKQYGIPADNPFANGGGAPEVFMVGLRNPWRWSFDRANGDMWIGDVGQNAIEELDVIPAGQQNGKNLGWSVYEANSCYNGNGQCGTLQAFTPQYSYQHAGAFNCVIGGQVYRGSCYPDLIGYYFFTDNGASQLMRAHMDAGTLTTTMLQGTWPGSPSSIHADSRGELYETTTGGGVYHLEAGP